MSLFFPIQKFLVHLLCTLTFKKVYFHHFSFDDYTFDGLNPYLFSRNYASDLLLNSLKHTSKGSLENYIAFLYAKNQQLKLECLIRRLLFVYFVSPDHDPNTIFLVSCDKLSLITYQDSNSNILDFRIPIDYNFYMVDFWNTFIY